MTDTEPTTVPFEGPIRPAGITLSRAYAVAAMVTDPALVDASPERRAAEVIRLDGVFTRRWEKRALTGHLNQAKRKRGKPKYKAPIANPKKLATYPAAHVARITELHATGLFDGDIAAEAGLTRATVNAIRGALGLRSNRQIAQMRAAGAPVEEAA